MGLESRSRFSLVAELHDLQVRMQTVWDAKETPDLDDLDARTLELRFLNMEKIETALLREIRDRDARDAADAVSGDAGLSGPDGQILPLFAGLSGRVSGVCAGGDEAP